MDFLKLDMKTLLRSGTIMNANELYITLAAIQGELQNTVGELFAMFCLENKDGGENRHATQAFSTILKKCKDLNQLETLEYGFIKNRIYDTNDEGEMVLRDEINLKILDTLFLYDSMKNLKGFPTFQEKLQHRRRLKSCKQALHQQCCLACNHKCKKCDKKECKDDSCHPGAKCNQHPCRNCDETKEICLHSSSICCKKCETCFYCGSKMKLEVSERCNRLRLTCGLETLRKFRQLLEKLTFKDCELLLDGKHTLPGFQLCRSFRELSDYLLKAYKEVLNYMSIAEHFIKQQPLSSKDIQKKVDSLATIFKTEDRDWLLYMQHDDVIKILGFINEARAQPSEEYHYVINKIEELKSDEKFKRHRSEVMVERENGDSTGSLSRDVNFNLESVTINEIENSKSEIETNENEVFETETLNEQLINNDSQQHEEDVAVAKVTGEHEGEATSTDVTDSTTLKPELKENEGTDVTSADFRPEESARSKCESPVDYELNKQPDSKTSIHSRTDPEMIEVINNLQQSVDELKESSVTYQKELDEKLQTFELEHIETSSNVEEMNNKVLSQLSVVMEKLVTMEEQRKVEAERQQAEIEEIKKNQKKLLEMLETKQKEKASKKKHNIFKHKVH
ncbi:putative leucine-rich repeat-containing protein DDB_G0290503 isoform X2 [Clytia hemisphaerica]|uniref:Uncharacterized protein n=1 Tax=Clytia hemisphaerica TaxID=252671 RepID=A0A7M5X0X5_9CNID